jgi:nucleotide-binding universal stress UspA family protein
VLVGPQCTGAWPGAGDRLLACLDGSPTAGAIVEPASEWAKALNLDLWLAEVFHPLDVESAQEPYRFLNTVVEQLKPDLPDVRAVASWSTYPAGEIVELARTFSASLIAMGTHSRAGVPKLALGSVTMAVAHAAPCPVLTVHPYAGLPI